VTSIMAVKKQREQIETLLSSPNFSGEFIKKEYLERFLSNGTDYLSGIEGTLFHKLLLALGVVMTVDCPDVAHGFKGYKTSAGHFYRFVLENMGDRMRSVDLPNQIMKLRKEMGAVYARPQDQAEGFSREVIEESKRAARGLCAMTGEVLVDSPAYKDMIRNVMSEKGISGKEAIGELKVAGRTFTHHCIDHIIPKTKGGKDAIENAQFVKAEMDQSKGNRTPYGKTTTMVGFRQAVDFYLEVERTTEGLGATKEDVLRRLDKMCFFPEELRGKSIPEQSSAVED
jgi:hypothetical protein